MRKLQSCPFCGVRAYYIDQGSRQIVECGGCGVTMEGLDGADAIAHWNMRHPSTPDRSGSAEGESGLPEGSSK